MVGSHDSCSTRAGAIDDSSSNTSYPSSSSLFFSLFSLSGSGRGRDSAKNISISLFPALSTIFHYQTHVSFLNPPIKPFAKPLVTDTLSPKLMQNPNSGPPADTTSSVARYLPARFRSIILACLDANLPRSAAFYAERYFALDNKCHDALHLYSTSLLRCGQTQSALWLVSPPYQKDPCPECRVVQADCYTALGQHAQAGAALEASLQESPLSDIGNV